ncbi:DUF805 domain-containing protein [Staphylococcus taiwanensis]|nr:DUF805 domain-containing protein [Staphylococcus taiwanensis]
MIEAYQLFWKNYLNVKDRTRRRHYWFALLCNIIVLIIISLICDLFIKLFSSTELFFNVLYTVIDLIVLIGVFTMSVRRFHDTGRTMTIPLILLIFMLIQEVANIIDHNETVSIDHFFSGVMAIIAAIILIIFSVALLALLIIAVIYCATDSEKGTNQYGPNPKGE